MQETLSVKNGAIILMTGKKFRKEQNQAQQNWKMWTEMELLQLMIKNHWIQVAQLPYVNDKQLYL